MAASNAMPVTMPGNAMGNTNSTVSESLPGKCCARERERRERAEHEREAVAQAATPSDRLNACQMSARPKATSNQCSVSPGGGNW